MSATTPFLQSTSSRPGRPWRVAAWIAVLAWAGTIYWFSCQSGRDIDRMNFFRLWDKAAHFLAFFSGAPALYCAIRWSFGASAPKAVVVTVMVLAGYGASDEIHQLFTPHRSGADLYDWTADALGSITGASLTAFLYARTQRNQSAPQPSPSGN